MSVYGVLNVIVRFLLRSPLHGLLSGSTLVITVRGRRSGRRYAVPVSYVRNGSLVRCFTRGGWWKNLRGGAPVTVLVRGKLYAGMAEPETDDREAIAAGLTDLFQAVPRDLRFYGVKRGPDGRPDSEGVRRAAAKLVMIRVRLTDGR